MGKGLLLGFLIIGMSARICAQEGFVSENTTLSYNVFDKNGKAFVNPSPEVAGSPFLSDNWRLGSLVIMTNRRFDSIKIRLNLFSQEVHFLDRNNNEMSLAKGYIKEVFFPGNLPGTGGLRFQNGFPAIDEQDAQNFYQVLTEGRCRLLHSVRKVIATEKDEMTKEVKKEYRTYEDYYLYDGKTMTRVKKDKAVIAGKEIKFKTIDDLKKAIDAYNAS
ncbi:MAG TPA: hypothetical protein VNW04_03585 [Puia sp.]|jgi:hypothetical protein|nr:hypothetical protein [Puia sp.]